VFAGDIEASRLDVFLLENDGVLGVRDSETGETFFIANDVESLSIGSQTYDLEALWA
jgi:hypothetical protein